MKIMKETNIVAKIILAYIIGIVLFRIVIEIVCL